VWHFNVVVTVVGHVASQRQRKKKVKWHGLQETIEKEEEEDLEAKLAEAISSVPEMDDEEEVSG
jgi:hypothetical protein